MKLISILIFILVFFAGTNAQAQPKNDFSLVRTYTGNISDAAIDNLDDLYIISPTGQIRKFTPGGDSINYDQVKQYGKLYSLDVSNPLKLLLFYKDYSTIIILDRFFATIATIDLRRFNIFQPDAIGLSYDNNIWVFDEYDGKLKKIDEKGMLLLETTDLRSIFNETISPQKILNENGLVYIADSSTGIFVFDNYGSFKKIIPLKNWQSFAIHNSNIISTNKEMIIVYNGSTFIQTERKNPFFKPYIHSFLTANKFVTFSSDSLHIYNHRF